MFTYFLNSSMVPAPLLRSPPPPPPPTSPLRRVKTITSIAAAVLLFRIASELIPFDALGRNNNYPQRYAILGRIMKFPRLITCKRTNKSSDPGLSCFMWVKLVRCLMNLENVFSAPLRGFSRP